MFREYKEVVITYIALITIGLIPLVLFDNMDLFMKINKYHNPILDKFFYYVSFLGNGFLYVGLFFILILLKVNNRPLLGAGIGLTITAIIVKFMKLYLFKSKLRPFNIIPINFDIHLSKNFSLNSEASFPSGHSAVIFSMVCFIILLLNLKSYWNIIFFILAILVAYSRIYLGHHFYRDVYFGALIGGLSTIMSYLYINSLQIYSKLLDDNLINVCRSILNYFFNKT